MPTTASHFVEGICSQWLHSPKGGIEGVLLQRRDGLVQVSLPPEIGAALAEQGKVGKPMRFLATPDRSPKTQEAAHPVFEFESLADAKGQPRESPAVREAGVLKGVVAGLHYAKHGEPNGVLLGTGDFIHLKPHGMAQVDPKVGDRIRASGEMRMTLLGTRLLEAHCVNGIDL